MNTKISRSLSMVRTSRLDERPRSSTYVRTPRYSTSEGKKKRTRLRTRWKRRRVSRWRILGYGSAMDYTPMLWIVRVFDGACSVLGGDLGEAKPRAGGTRGRVCRQRLVRRVARGIVDLSRVLSRGSRSREARR